MPRTAGTDESDRSALPLLPLSSGGEPPQLLARFYIAPPAGPSEHRLFKATVESDSTLSVAPIVILVNGNKSTDLSELAGKITSAIRCLFSRDSGPLRGAPASPRRKHYQAQSGIQYNYYYQGHRNFHSRHDTGMEYVFGVTAGRRKQCAVGVFLANGVLTAWEQAHGRRFSAAEQYAIAKMALFQAFDERARPELMRADVVVRTADLDAIVETLGIE